MWRLFRPSSAIGSILGTACLSLPWLVYSLPFFQRPPRTPVDRLLFPGAIYRREIRQIPRPLVIHSVEIGLRSPDIHPFVTPPESLNQVKARTTTRFLQEFKLAVAVNGNFFYPFRETSPWNFYPQSGDRVEVLGDAISNGRHYGHPAQIWSSLCFSVSGQATILPGQACPPQTRYGLAGRAVLLKNGRPMRTDPLPNDKAYPHTAVGLSDRGTHLWLLVIDGKQPLYSEGVTEMELMQIGQDKGIVDLLVLDGGGSATLAIATSKGAQVLNSPIHTKLALRQRPVANHLGIAAP